MIELPILSMITFLPLVGAIFILFIRGKEEIVSRNARYTALYTSLFTFGLSLYMLAKFNADIAGFQLVEEYEWFKNLPISYVVGIDGISVFFVLLSTFLTPICILASWKSIKTRTKEYLAAFLILETLMIGTFTALDTFLFYVFFEAVLIPMFLIIGIWGGARRVYASFKFFLYTLLGSVLMLLAMFSLYSFADTSNITELMNVRFPVDMQKWLWLAFFASFAVKMPMWPVHTWLPDAHVEAPTAGSVILAGVLLKMGGYGFLRFSLPMFPDASAYFSDMVYWMSIAAIIYTSLVALVQTDMKKMIAYSSVAHMGFVTLGIFTANIHGIQGAMFQMISHGVISAALFLIIGVVYDRLHTREIAQYGGIVKNMPKFATIFMIMMLGSVGLPGTSGFVGEFLSLVGIFREDTIIAALAASGIILGAAYMLLLYRNVVFGEVTNEAAAKMKDITPREFAIFTPLVALVLILGIFPNLILHKTEASVQALVNNYEASLALTAQEIAEAETIEGMNQIRPAAGTNHAIKDEGAF